MSNKQNLIKGAIITCVGILSLLGMLYLFVSRSESKNTPLTPDRVMPQQGRQKGPSVAQKATNEIVYLYFANKENTHLISEERRVPFPDNPVALGRIIMKELIKGPEKGLMRTIPKQTVLNALYITNAGTAYVDVSEGIKENHPGGVKMELMTIYSIVNSLVLNIPEIRTVKILVQGRESMTLAGHIDLRFPFKANMMLVR